MGDNSCNNCDTDCTDTECDYVISSVKTSSTTLQQGCGLSDGSYTNATVVVSGGCIINVQNGEGIKVNIPVCGGGGSIINSIVTGGGTGTPGAAATITIEPTVIELPYGSQPTVSNIGTPNNAIIQFSMPSVSGLSSNTQPEGIKSGSNNVLEVSNGIVTDLTVLPNGGFIHTIATAVTGSYDTTFDVAVDALNKGTIVLSLNLTGIGSTLNTVNSSTISLTQEQATLTSRLTELETIVSSINRG